jgi:hypothetical protein
MNRHCPTCRDLFDEVREAGDALRHAKPFAHAHHVITGRIETARIDYLAKSADYRIHKTQCRQARLAGKGVTA